MISVILLLYFLCSCVNADVIYHTTDEILNTLGQLCNHPQMSCSWTDEILVMDYNAHLEPDQLWVFNEHARERITGEIALYTVKSLLYKRPNRRVTIIPVLNVWGRRQVDQGRTCLRKNRNGVDTNRNYQVFSHYSYPKDSEEYEGPQPLSEKETKLVASLLQRGTKRYINVHSGEYSMYMPFDSSRSAPPHAEKMRAFLTALHPFCEKCVEGSAAKVSTYKAYGTSVDYAIRNANVPEAYTFEVYGAMSYDCAKMFNPFESSTYRSTIAMWRQILLYTLQL